MVFEVGSEVVIRKGGSLGIIRQALGKGKWNIEIVDADDAKPTGLIISKSSQALRAPKENEWPCPLVDGDIEVTTDGVVSANESNDSFVDENWEEKKNEEIDQASRDVTTAPDDDDGEDIAFFVADEDGDDVVNPNDLAAVRGIEVDPDKHKQKWDKYIEAKEALIASKWSVEIKPPGQSGYEVGVRVKEKQGQKRCGTIVEDFRRQQGLLSLPRWTVVWDGDSLATAEQDVPTTRIKRIKDSRVFKWTVVRDSSATNPPIPFLENGIVGFNFEEQFEPSRLNPQQRDGDRPYEGPFLKLLIHLWPGNWRDQLRNLNVYLEQENEQNTRHKSKRKKSLVTGRLATCTTFSAWV